MIFVALRCGLARGGLLLRGSRSDKIFVIQETRILNKFTSDILEGFVFLSIDDKGGGAKMPKI